ncbi:MAG: CoA transferase, partial [Burkholderiaceae bacterium]
LQARGTFVEIEGVMQPAPAPRFSRTPSAKPTPPVDARPDNAAHALNGWLAPERIADLSSSRFFESTK